MHAEYLGQVFDKPQRANVIIAAQSVLKEFDYDCIAVRGTSGLVIGSVLAHLDDKNLAVVRKDAKDSHSKLLLESPQDVRRYIFIDDFISSGKTLYAVVAAMKAGHPDAICVGAYTYNWSGIYGVAGIERQVEAFKKLFPEEAFLLNDFYKKVN